MSPGSSSTAPKIRAEITSSVSKAQAEPQEYDSTLHPPSTPPYAVKVIRGTVRQMYQRCWIAIIRDVPRQSWPCPARGHRKRAYGLSDQAERLRSTFVDAVSTIQPGVPVQISTESRIASNLIERGLIRTWNFLYSAAQGLITIQDTWSTVQICLLPKIQQLSCDALLPPEGGISISRRDFMVEATAAGMTIALPRHALWTKQRRGGHPEVEGGTFRLGLHDGNTADQMDPGKYQSVGEIQMAHTHRSYLTQINRRTTASAPTWPIPGARRRTPRCGRSNSTRTRSSTTAGNSLPSDAIASLNHHRGDEHDLGGEAASGERDRHSRRWRSHDRPRVEPGIRGPALGDDRLPPGDAAGERGRHDRVGYGHWRWSLQDRQPRTGCREQRLSGTTAGIGRARILTRSR